MAYFVTGGTGFIGSNLIERLLQRDGDIYVLVREGSRGKLEDLKVQWGDDADRVKPVVGDLTAPLLGCEDQITELDGKIDHFFHLGAIYDMAADAASQQRSNVEGTSQAVALAERIKAGCFHMTSSIAAAGLYPGTFTEGMFDEAVKVDSNPYFQTKHESEGVVRDECEVSWRVYRPGIVVGDSETGAIDKIDGPYYFFKAIQRLRSILPQWFPSIGIEGGEINIVPVDFVADAMDHIAHLDGLDGETFHLTDPSALSAGQVVNVLAKAAHAPEAAIRIDSKMFDFVPSAVRAGVGSLPPVKRISDQVLDDLGIPRNVLFFLDYPTKFDSTIEVAIKLGVDPRKADQMIRGTVSLPNGTGKTARVIVFATGAAADAARAAGADEVGGDELIEKVAAGWTDFDSAVATPELMGKVGRLGKVLGPRNLMPNPKTGTVTPDTAKAVTDIKGGKIEFRVDKQANLHFIVGKASFSAEKLHENLRAALDEILRLKPASSKGKYVLKAAIATTFGPGVPLDTNF